jgi:putative peptidoglycan lipid II flippase
MLKSTLILTICTLVSQILAFVIQIVIAANFGAGQKMDAYLAGVTLPQYITTILTSTLVAVFIPVFISYNSKNSEDALRVMSGIMNLCFIVSFTITVLGLIFAYPLIELTVPGLTPEAKSMAYKTALIFWPSVLFSSIQYLLISLYQARKDFIWQAIVPIIGGIIQLLLIIILKKYFDIYVLTFIALTGIIIQTLLLSKILFTDKFQFRLFFKHPGVIEFIHLIIPLIIANIFIKITPIVERFFASNMYTGSISHLNYASKITMVISTLLTIGLSTIIFPLLSEALSSNNVKLFKETVAKGLRNMWILLAPIICFGLVLSLSVVSLVFERGAFNHKDSIEVSNLLQIYILSLLASSFGSITGKSLYALKLTKLLSIVGVLESIAYIVYTRFLAYKFGVYGLAIGYAIYFTISFSWHMIVIKIKTKSAPGPIFSITFIKTLVSAIISSAIILFLIQLFNSNLVKIIVGFGLGSFLYLLFLYLTRSEETLLLKEKVLLRYFKKQNKI